MLAEQEEEKGRHMFGGIVTKCRLKSARLREEEGGAAIAQHISTNRGQVSFSDRHHF
jgi:hypothetical protein